MIEIQDLQVRFGQTPVIRGIDLSVAAGESFGIVGESGCGKTTVLRTLSGLVTDWTGRITLNGAEVGRGRRSRAAAKLAQMVFQDPYGSLHPRQTVDRILSEAAAIHRLDRIEARVVQTLTAVGLGPAFRFRYPHQLSGGQRQRVAIARALIVEPRILLLDEPTSALDVSVQAEILNLLRRLRAERDLTLVLVSHNLAVVANLTDRVAVMNHGQVVELLSNQQLRALEPNHPYTRQLLRASRGYERAAADMVEAEA